MNRMALKIAREVADETGTLMAGDICSTNLYDPKDPKKNEAVKQCFVVNLFARSPVLIK